MITLRSTPTTVVLTPLRDHPFIEAPQAWCFSFSGKDTSRIVNVIVTDESPSPGIYQRFTVNADLKPFGMWYYSLWTATGTTLNDVVYTGSPLSFGLAVSTT